MILFLDFDGVLNSETSACMYRYWAKNMPGMFADLTWVKHEFCPGALAHICELLDENPDLNVVVSSAWRLGTTVDELKEHFSNTTLAQRIIDKTPYLAAVQRGVEIKDWLKRNPTEKFVIFDDDNDMDDVIDNFIQTDWRVGVTYKNIYAAKRILGLVPPDPDPQNKY